MKLIMPEFYEKFVCTAARCSDNCCVGWEIDIDDAAMVRFSAVEGEFGEQLRAAIRLSDGCPVFALGEGERCALLRDDGLCRLILSQGEDSLCDICALHPRFFEWYNNTKEAGLGLCCEEVVRLLFSDSNPLSFLSRDISEEAEPSCDEQLFSLLNNARNELFSLLQTRSIPLGKRLCRAAVYVGALQNNIDNDDYSLPQKVNLDIQHSYNTDYTIKSLITLLGQTESLNSEWDSTLSRLTASAETLAKRLPAYLRSNADALWRYEHIAVYAVYRYFLKGTFDGEIISKFGFMCIFLLTLLLLDTEKCQENKTLSEWDRVLNLKLLSKQLEYSDENVEKLYDAAYSEGLSPCEVASLLADIFPN